nr:VPGUxxT family thioredoxin-like (seleno)protein, type 2 [Myxococcota bacterium]
MNARRALLVLGLVLLALLSAGVGSSAPAELGRVEWGRDLNAALARAGKEGPPLFVLFQEVPGCQTCVSFGEQVLSHPLLVEAIETAFQPVLVYNNRPGDVQWLKRFGEPSWNNPVVRFLGADGSDLIPRKSGVWTPDAVGRRMIRALKAANRPVPAYLRDAVDELRPRVEERVAFGMHCYWSGEACLGDIPGVLSSRAGYLNGGEAVELVFDAEQIGLEQLAAEARARGCAERALFPSGTQESALRAAFGDAAERYDRRGFRLASDDDQKRNLLASPLRGLDLTPRQAVRVNTALATRGD